MNINKNKTQDSKDTLLKVIRKAVKEAVREEFQNLINEGIISSSQQPTKTLQEVQTTTQEVPAKSINEIFHQTKNSLDRDTIKNFLGNAPQVITQDFQTPSSPNVGVSIDNLDFVKRASTVFNLAEQKSKTK